MHIHTYTHIHTHTHTYTHIHAYTHIHTHSPEAMDIIAKDAASAVARGVLEPGTLADILDKYMEMQHLVSKRVCCTLDATRADRYPVHRIY